MKAKIRNLSKLKKDLYYGKNGGIYSKETINDALSLIEELEDMGFTEIDAFPNESGAIHVAVDTLKYELNIFVYGPNHFSLDKDNRGIYDLIVDENEEEIYRRVGLYRDSIMAKIEQYKY
jgi:hypothetical protein